MDRLRIFAFTLFAFLVSSTALAEEPRPLVVGVIPAPPFVMHDPDGSWTGLSIELWKQVARDAGISFTIKQLSVADVDHLREAGVDVFVSRNVTAHSVEVGAMTHSFLSAGLAIATRSSSESGFFAIARKMTSRGFAVALGGLALVLFAMGVVVWRLEAAAKPEEFGGHPLRGIAHGTFWAFESVVGKASGLSRSIPARVVTLGWSLLMTAVVSGLTAKLASELTVSQLTTSVSGPDDLPRVRVGAVSGTSAARYLEARGIGFRPCANAAGEIEALEKNEIDAAVDESPLLKYQVHRRTDRSVVVLPGEFLQHGYGFAFPARSDLERRVDTAMLRTVEGSEWPALVARYLGGA